MNFWQAIKNKPATRHLYWGIIFPYCLWYIWKNRNTNTFENKRDILKVDLVFGMAMKFFVMCPTKQKQNTPYELIHVRWIPPKSGFIKLNTDSANSSCPGPRGIGGVFRTNTGNWTMGFSAPWHIPVHLKRN